MSETNDKKEETGKKPEEVVEAVDATDAELDEVSGARPQMLYGGPPS